MPKDEFDFDDPLELNGVGIVCGEDTTEAMAECLIEEFMRLGHNHKQILALFRNPHYIGMNMALQNRGEQFVREKISEVFARWGKPVAWPTASVSTAVEAQTPSPSAAPDEDKCLPASAPAKDRQAVVIDPMGVPIPDMTF
jgi:hypothetical protein